MVQFEQLSSNRPEQQLLRLPVALQQAQPVPQEAAVRHRYHCFASARHSAAAMVALAQRRAGQAARLWAARALVCCSSKPPR